MSQVVRSRVRALSGWSIAIVLSIIWGVALMAIPADRVQGDAQRIMYVHVPSAWSAYLAFFITFAGSLLFLRKRDLRFDRVAAASAELGVVFTGLTIVTGSIWGRVTWGVWWDWDPRLTTTAVMFLSYVAYVLLRGSIMDRNRRARVCAVVGIIAFVQVPVVHFSVVWWRSLHQPPTVLRPGDPTIDHTMLAVLLLSVLTFTALFLWLLLRRISVEELADEAHLAMLLRP